MDIIQYYVTLVSFPLKNTAQKMKSSVGDFFSKCEETADMVIFTEEILNGKLHFCAV